MLALAWSENGCSGSARNVSALPRSVHCPLLASRARLARPSRCPPTAPRCRWMPAAAARCRQRRRPLPGRSPPPWFCDPLGRRRCCDPSLATPSHRRRATCTQPPCTFCTCWLIVYAYVGCSPACCPGPRPLSSPVSRPSAKPPLAASPQSNLCLLPCHALASVQNAKPPLLRSSATGRRYKLPKLVCCFCISLPC